MALDYNLLKNVTLPSSVTLMATIPPGIAPGVHDIQVIQPNMQSGRLARAFTMWGKTYLPAILKNWPSDK